MKWLYTVTCIRKMSSLEDGALWSEMLPDELFEKQYVFDGWEAHVCEKEVQTYELFWYPKKYEHAMELMTRLEGMKDHVLFEGCNFRLSILRG